ncbi:MAG: polysaccharide deacetylase family protein [Bacteroidales bacterium]|jgi:peptidoglycan/xylan/chitin deacetylase (PgdA/CDA1 family)|nr:polysaccharide deacetylase family protein [Bacteroidales bacterium]
MYTIRLPFFLRLPLKNLIWRIPQQSKTVYLTFDDGPIPEVTPWLLNLLEQEDVKATFFCVGENVQKYRDIYNQILAKGHSVGQHTYNHLPAFKSNKKDYQENVLAAKEFIRTDLFRPPHGQIWPSQLIKMRKHYRIVLWDVLSGDFDQSISAEKCLNNVINKVRNGSIIVFHDSLKAEKNLRHALPRAIRYMKDDGYKFGAL